VQICRRNSKSVNNWLFSKIISLFPSLPALYTNDQRNKLQDSLKNEEDNFKKKHKVEEKISFFSSTCHCCRACGCGSFCNAIVVAVAITVHCNYRSLQLPSMAIRRLWPSTVHGRPWPSVAIPYCIFQTICTYFSRSYIGFKKLIHTFAYSRINTYIYIFRINHTLM
jgi:hypothetical protein